MAVEVIPEQQPAAPPKDQTELRNAPGRLTFEEYLDWLDENTHADWVNGEVVMHSPVSFRHQKLRRFLLLVISTFVDEHSVGEVSDDPFQMRLEPAGSSRAPDILYIAAEHLDRLKPSYLDGPADLVVEIISPESQGRDRGEKYYEYERGGVREYWLIDPERRRAEFYVLSDDGAYASVQSVDGVYRSAVLEGLWIRESWLWQDPQPSLVGVLQEWSAA